MKVAAASTRRGGADAQGHAIGLERRLIPRLDLGANDDLLIVPNLEAGEVTAYRVE